MFTKNNVKIHSVLAAIVGLALAAPLSVAAQQLPSTGTENVVDEKANRAFDMITDFAQDIRTEAQLAEESATDEELKRTVMEIGMRAHGIEIKATEVEMAILFDDILTGETETAATADTDNATATSLLDNMATDHTMPSTNGTTHGNQLTGAAATTLQEHNQMMLDEIASLADQIRMRSEQQTTGGSGDREEMKMAALEIHMLAHAITMRAHNMALILDALALHPDDYGTSAAFDDSMFRDDNNRQGSGDSDDDTISSGGQDDSNSGTGTGTEDQ